MSRGRKGTYHLKGKDASLRRNRRSQKKALTVSKGSRASAAGGLEHPHCLSQPQKPEPQTHLYSSHVADPSGLGKIPDDCMKPANRPSALTNCPQGPRCARPRISPVNRTDGRVMSTLKYLYKSIPLIISHMTLFCSVARAIRNRYITEHTFTVR